MATKTAAVVLVLSLLAGAAFAAGEDEALTRARKLVEEKNYAAAISIYQGLEDWLGHDPGLLIEWARVYSYADRNAEAASLFERVTRDFPQRAEEIRKEMADQRGYANLARARKLVEQKDYSAALELYGSMGSWMEHDPGLLIEWARVYSYADRNAEAASLFERVTRDFPQRAEEIRKEMADQRGYANLACARKLVEQKDYSAALELYGSMGNWLEHDPGLLIEWARVYEYANRNAEAASLFERVRDKYPQAVPQFLRELGDMYVWQSELDKGIEVYKAAVAANPADAAARMSLARAYGWHGEHDAAIETYDALLAAQVGYVPALIGKAEILGWEDRLGESDELLRQAIERDPSSIDALNMRARNMVWNGYHRRGAEMYREILKRYPNNPDALEGLAFALHWEGRDAEALAELEKLLAAAPSRREAGKLVQTIRLADRPFAVASGSFFQDNFGRTVLSPGLTAGVLLGHVTTVDGTYQWLQIEDNFGVGRVSGHRGGLGVSTRLGEQIGLQGRVKATTFDESDWQPVTWSAGGRWQPLDCVSVEASYEHELIERVDAVTDGVAYDAAAASAKLRPNRFWYFSGEGKNTDYSDGNRQVSALGIAEYRILQNPFVKIYYNFYFTEWDQFGNYYFSPSKFRAQTLGLYASRKITNRLFVEMQDSFGVEQREDFEGRDAEGYNFFVAGGLSYIPDDNWRLALSARYFESFPRYGADYIGYNEFMVNGSLTYYFGSVPLPVEANEVIREPDPARRRQ